MHYSVKYHAKPWTYGICGRLASGCSHMVCLTREDWRKVVKRFATTRRMEWTRGGNREYNLALATSKHLFKGYTYSEVYAYVVRS